MTRKLRPRAAFVTLLVMATCGIAAASANAASIVYFEGWTTSQLGPANTLNQTSIRLFAGAIGCTGARNLDLSSAGIDLCTQTLGGTIAHPFGNVMRYGWCGTPVGYGSSLLRCREDY